MNRRRLVISCLVLALAVPACRDSAPPPVETPAAPPARTAVGLLGTWVRTPPLDARHDTLVLRADSTATGWTRQAHDSSTVLAVAHWRVGFLSKDPAVTRTDMPGRYQDGGDAGCTFRPDSTCISAPVLCLVPSGAKGYCQGMTFRGDTLWLSEDGRYVRIAGLDSAVPRTRADVDFDSLRSTTK